MTSRTSSALFKDTVTVSGSNLPVLEFGRQDQFSHWFDSICAYCDSKQDLFRLLTGDLGPLFRNTDSLLQVFPGFFPTATVSIGKDGKTASSDLLALLPDGRSGTNELEKLILSQGRGEPYAPKESKLSDKLVAEHNVRYVVANRLLYSTVFQTCDMRLRMTLTADRGNGLIALAALAARHSV
jgi:hypothetical protein